MRQPETTRQWLEYYEKLQSKAYYNYQETGLARYDTQQYKYDVICDAFRAKLKEEKERGSEISKRMLNRDATVDRLVKTEYTRDEVIKLLDNAIWW